jgi:hypothetical protein
LEQAKFCIIHDNVKPCCAPWGKGHIGASGTVSKTIARTATPSLFAPNGAPAALRNSSRAHVKIASADACAVTYVQSGNAPAGSAAIFVDVGALFGSAQA